jgi:AraC family ethanolamine operon transcriptional activator
MKHTNTFFNDSVELYFVGRYLAMNSAVLSVSLVLVSVATIFRVLITQVEQFIQQNLTESITIPQIASRFNVSERTLLYAFKKRFGISTKSFIKTLKLNAVHKELYNNPDNHSISSIAKKHGFWHMGQFYADYKAFFGELPSETQK